jgi:LysR family transcriptional regulator, transcriptional activator of the cysJI operon
MARPLSNMDQLRILDQIVAAGSFSAAARNLSLTQPGVSKQVRALERHFGLPLLDRSGRRVRLTEAGERALAGARDVIGRIDQLELELADFRAGAAGRLRLAASTSFGDYVLPTIVRRFRELVPNAEVILNIGNTELVHAGVTEGTYDIGIAAGPFLPQDLLSEELCPDPLLLFVGSSHPLLRRRNVHAIDLDEFVFVLPIKGSPAWVSRVELLERNGIHPRRWLEIGHPEAMKRDVAGSTDVGLLGLQCVARELDAGELSRLEPDGVRFASSYYLFRHPGRFVTRLMARFTSYLEAELARAPFWAPHQPPEKKRAIPSSAKHASRRRPAPR